LSGWTFFCISQSFLHCWCFIKYLHYISYPLEYSIICSFGMPANFFSFLCIPYFFKHDESTSYSSRLSRKGKRNICNGKGVSTLAGPSRKGRRLRRNLVDDVVLAPSILDFSPDDHLFKADRLQTDAEATSSLSGGVNSNIILQNSEGPNAGLRTESSIINGGSDDIEQIKDSVHISTRRSSTLFVENAVRVPQTSIDLCSSHDEKFSDGDQVDNGAGLPTSTEMSCVICFTDFSTTRGILPCGHRFCYPCIQSWVDLRVCLFIYLPFLRIKAY